MFKNSTKSNLSFIFIISIIVAVLDQVSKYLVNKNMKLEETIPVIKNFFHITYVQNKGVVFGLFYGQTSVFSIVTFAGLAIVIGLVFYIIKNLDKLTFIQKLSYGLILGGAIGNSIDRVIYGYVIDFIDFRGLWYYIFNIADTFINIGIGLLLLESFFTKKDTQHDSRGNN